MIDNPYAAMIEALQKKGIRAQFRPPIQLLLPSRIWIACVDHQWYVSTWVPACYPVPADVDLVELCRECLEGPSGSFYTLPEDIAKRYGLHRMTNEEFDALFSGDELDESED